MTGTPRPLLVRPSHRKLFSFHGVLSLLPDIAPVKAGEKHEGYAGWGLRRYASGVIRRAKKEGKPYIALEDGFLRSVGLGRQGAALLSLVADGTGVYYDCSRPSDLERLCAQELTPAQLARGASFLSQLRLQGVTKYNVECAPLPPEMRRGRHVVIFDQTAGDASLIYGGAEPDAFSRMAEFALEAFPGCTVWIKTHPDVAAGKARSCLSGYVQDPRFRRLTVPVSPYALAQVTEAALCVTSQAGFECLLAGGRVFCFGFPFYAGMGLTEDMGRHPFGARVMGARPRGLSLEALVHQALIAYPRYRDPFNDTPAQPETAADILATVKSRYLDRGGDFHCAGFSGWKHPFVRQCLGSPFSKVTFYFSVSSAARAAREKGGNLAVWSSKAAYRAEAERSGVPLKLVEDGFLRSATLGSALTPGWSLAVDGKGIYYDSSRPSDLEDLLNYYDMSDAEMSVGKEIADAIVSHAVTKYRISNEGRPYVRPETRKSIHLVIGQVDDDASVLCSPPGSIIGNAKLLEYVAEHYPDGLLLYRPHPDVTAGYRAGALPPDAKGYDRAGDVQGYALHDLLRAADHVHTISSLAGLEALCYGKLVHTYGAPFYAGWGLTRDRISLPRRTRRRTAEELIYIAFALYPFYVDPVTSYPCDVRVLLSRFTEKNGAQLAPRLKGLARFRWTRFAAGALNYLKQ